MGKFGEYQLQPKKDKFFISKQQNQGSYNKHSQFKKPVDTETSTSSGSFFVCSSEKQQILQQRQEKTRPWQKSRPAKNGTKAAVAEKELKPKKQFDKKKWRLQKYSKKYKLQQWEEKRKKTVLNEYYQQIKDDEPQVDVKKIYEKYGEEDESDEGRLGNREENENENNLNNDLSNPQTITDFDSSNTQPTTSRGRKKKAFKNAHLEYQRIQDEKKQKKEEFLKKKAERDQAIQEYKQKKLEKYKKLSKKTKKGQPIMKYRMEMLLEQIQKSVGSGSV